MTIYYIDPAAGADSNTGLSWAQAWSTLRGLRIHAVVPVAGDEIRFAKSSQYTPSTYPHTRGGGAYPKWHLRGEPVLDCEGGDPWGMVMFQSVIHHYGVRSPVGHYNGAVTVDVPESAYVWESNYAQSHATAYSGEYNATGTDLFGINLGNLQGEEAVTLTRLVGAVRCHVPYSGVGDINLPAGSIVLSVYLNTTLVASLPLPEIRNSSTIWTPFSLALPALANTYTANFNIRVSRAGAALSRDSSAFGLEFSEFCFEYAGSVGAVDTVLSVTRTSAESGSSGTTTEIVGDNNIKMFYETLNPVDARETNQVCSLSVVGNQRFPLSPVTHTLCYVVPDVHLVGTHALSPSGSLGAYDLNGSAGGTSASPLKLTGGWNTGTNEVDGVTLFSAGISHKTASPFALFDLQNANHVRLENIGGAYGFASLFTRAGTVHAKSCMLPWSLQPAFGLPSTDTHVTLEDMYINQFLLEGFGVIGDLSLKNVYGAGYTNSKAYRYSEVRNLNMYDAHIRDFYALNVRGDAVLEQCQLINPPSLNSSEFGHALVFKNHKPALPSANARLIFTAASSRWDLIDYQDASYPTYTFTTPLSGAAASADAAIHVRASVIPLTEALVYSTTLRGSPAVQAFTDGMNDFVSSATSPMTGGASEASGRGYTYGHMTGARPYNYDIETPSNMTGMGDVLTPPWNYVSVSGAPREVTYDPDAAAAGRVFLVRRFENVSYRSPETVFVMTGRVPQYAGGLSWTTLKAIYVPRAGLYRAHFGLMKENLQFSFSFAGGAFSGFLRRPFLMTVPSLPISSGVSLGRLGVYCNTIVDGPQTKEFFASTAEEAASGSGNQYLDEWHDYYIDFATTAAGLVELRMSTMANGSYAATIIDVLNIYERT